MQKKFENLSVKFELTDHDRIKIGQIVAEATENLERIDDRLKEVKAQFKQEVEMETAKQKYASRCLTNGYEYRDVECEVVKDFDDFRIVWTDAKTGDEVKSREMTAREKQMDIEDVQT